MSELILVSVPDATKELDNRVKDTAEVYPLHVPSLQVGTFGTLVSLSDELAKADTFVETNTVKVAQLLYDLTEKKQTHEESLLVSGRTPENFVTKFEWDPSKFNTKLPLKEILQDINQKVSATEQDIKQKSAAYNKVKGELDALNRKTQGTLLTRSLDDVVTEEMFVNNSEYLITLLVVVPKSSYGSWISSYESLDPMVVPCSSEDITEDHEYKLVTVTLFRKALDAFKVAAREKKFIVREYEFQKSEASAQAEKKDGLMQDAKRKQGVLFNWCKVSFSELFQAWIHIKVLRIFVESVLRYGLPVNFRAYVLKPTKNIRNVRRVLEQAYSHLDKTSTVGPQVVDIPGLAGMGMEYYPYVNVDVKLSGVLL